MGGWGSFRSGTAALQFRGRAPPPRQPLGNTRTGTYSMKLGYVGVAVATLLISGCPSGGFLSELSGRGAGGGTGTNHLLFTVEPSNALANNIIRPPLQVTVQASLGRPDSAFAASVTVSILNNPVCGTLSATTSLFPFHGIALFRTLATPPPPPASP